VKSFYRNVYAPSNILITAAGQISHQKMVDLAGSYFSELSPRRRLAAASPPKANSRLVLCDRPTLEQVHLILGVPAYPVAHELRYAAYVLNTILGGSMSSRLFQNIREQRGLVYAVFSELNNFRDSGALTVYAGTSRQSVRQVIGLVLEEFVRLKDEPIPDEELTRAKNHLKGSAMLGLESTSSRMSNLARQQLYFGRFATLDEILAGIDAVTAESIQIVARDLFRSGSVAATVLGPLNGTRLRREDLAC
jgi:predicted Zn-dependent peptidase